MDYSFQPAVKEILLVIANFSSVRSIETHIAYKWIKAEQLNERALQH
jgi:hypothetical protein